MIFNEWLDEFKGIESSFGDLANDAALDEHFPKAERYEVYYNHLIKMRACENAIKTLYEAWELYSLGGVLTMDEVKKLIEYSNLAGFPLVPNGDKLTVENGTKLPYHLKQQIIIHKRDILEVLNEKEVNPL